MMGTGEAGSSLWASVNLSRAFSRSCWFMRATPALLIFAAARVFWLDAWVWARPAPCAQHASRVNKIKRKEKGIWKKGVLLYLDMSQGGMDGHRRVRLYLTGT